MRRSEPNLTVNPRWFFQELAPQDGTGYMDVGKVVFTLLPSQEQLSFCPTYGGGEGGRSREKRTPAPLTPPLASSQVCPRRPEGKVPRTPRERGSSGKEAGSSHHTRPGDPPTQGWQVRVGAGCSWVAGTRVGFGGGKAWTRDTERVRVGPQVRASAKLLPTPGGAGCPRPGLQDIARQCRATQASSSRSQKKSRSCWPHRRLCR